MRIEPVDGQVGPGLDVALGAQIRYWTQGGELMAMSNTGRSYAVKNLQRSGRRNGRAKAQGTLPLLSVAHMHIRDVLKLLNVGQNKIRILKLLRRGDWIKILRLLPKELLVNALRLFSKAKLLRLIMHLPKPLLMKLVLQLVKLHDLIKKMPTSEHMRILRSPRLNNRILAKALLTMEPKFQQLLLYRIYGGNNDYSKLKPYQLFQIFMHTRRERLNEAFKTMPFKFLQAFTEGLVKQDPKLLLHLSDRFIFKLLEKMPKPILIQGCMVLPPELLIKMLCQLPDPLLMLAASQVDDNVLEEYLIDQHPDLLRILAGAA